MFNRKYIFKWWIFHCHVSFQGCDFRVKHFCSFLCVVSKRRRGLRWTNFLKTKVIPISIHTKANHRVRNKAKGKSSSICIHTQNKNLGHQKNLTTSCLKSRMLSSTKFSHLHVFDNQKTYEVAKAFREKK